MTSCFKKRTKEEMEVEALNSQESAKTFSPLLSAVMTAIDLTALSCVFQPALTAIAT